MFDSRQIAIPHFVTVVSDTCALGRAMRQGYFPAAAVSSDFLRRHGVRAPQAEPHALWAVSGGRACRSPR